MIGPDAIGALVLFAGDDGETMRLAGKRSAHRLARGAATTATVTCETLQAPTSDVAPAFRVAIGGAPRHAGADVVVALTAAGLRSHGAARATGGLLLVNAGAIAPVEAAADVAAGGVTAVDLDALANEAAGAVALDEREFLRCRNYAALGAACALLGHATAALRCRTVATAPAAVRANRRALAAGFQLGQTLALAVSPPRALAA